MADYVSKYTGEEIDESIGKALKSIEVIPITTPPTNAVGNIVGLYIDDVPYTIVGSLAPDSFRLYRHTCTFSRLPYPNYTITIITPRSTPYQSVSSIFSDYINIIDVRVENNSLVYMSDNGEGGYNLGFYVSGEVIDYPVSNAVLISDYNISNY